MTNAFELDAENRQDVGKGASRRLRRLANKVPAILYGAKSDPQAISLDHNKVIKALENEAFYSHILTLNVEGKTEKVVLKALERHPSQPRIMHMDFQRVSARDKIFMQVPLHFTGEDVAPGVKLGGGSISHHMTSIEVTCLATDLPEFIEVDVSKLEIEHSIHIADITAPKGVEYVAITQGNNPPVVSIHKTRGSSTEDSNTTAGDDAASGASE